MQQVSVPIINNTECEGMYRRAGYVEHIPNIFICAGYKEGKQDSCEVRPHSLPKMVSKSVDIKTLLWGVCQDVKG